jgi:ATP-dependent DNA ligase
MLAKLSRELPAGDGLTYEPKWDGFRCIAYRDGDDVDLRSRNARPLARYFPELVEAFQAVAQQQYVVDGEIVVDTGAGLDFEALLARLHPAASRVARLRTETPAAFVAFDLLAVGDDDVRDVPFVQRRAALEELFVDRPERLYVTPTTRASQVARGWLERFRGGGLDGVMAKHDELPYQPGKRAMIKVKQQQTADCVVAGFRWHAKEAAPGSLLLGVYDQQQVLNHVGVASGFAAGLRRQLCEDVRPLVTDLGGHPWEHGFPLSVSSVGRLPGAVSRWSEGRELTWVPLAPVRVCEVAYDHLEGDRFRHAPRFRSWRPDREPASCTFEQFAAPGPPALLSQELPERRRAR